MTLYSRNYKLIILICFIFIIVNSNRAVRNLVTPENLPENPTLTQTVNYGVCWLEYVVAVISNFVKRSYNRIIDYNILSQLGLLLGFPPPSPSFYSRSE